MAIRVTQPELQPGRNYDSFFITRREACDLFSHCKDFPFPTKQTKH